MIVFRHLGGAPLDFHLMHADFQPFDEIVRIDRTVGTLILSVRSKNGLLRMITLRRPLWSSIQEIGFPVRRAEITHPDSNTLDMLRKRCGTPGLPEGLLEIRIADDEGTKIAVIFGAGTE